MKILFSVIYNKKGVLDWDCDHRFNILYNLLKTINDKHEIYYHISYINPHDKEKVVQLLQIFNLYDIENYDTNLEIFFDVSICWICVESINKTYFNYFKKISRNIIFYDHGPFKHSTFIDNIGWIPPNLPSYTNTINKLSEENYDEHKCSQYINHYLSNNFSKRKQSNTIDISSCIFNKYIFIPTQKHDDILLIKYKLNLFDFIEKVVIFSKKNNIPIVIKIHPHIGHLRDIQKIKINEIIIKHKYNNIYFSNSSINFLIKNARFTTILNGYLVMDNFLNQSPVLMTLPNAFMFTDAVIYNENIERGLETMLNGDFDKEKMYLKQRQIIWWFLENNFLFESNSIEKNIEILNKYTNDKITY